ncbi:hypothetical protein HMPREF9371_2278 [Neisseria shayeganii 871]|uniref:Uncharacterized protein n=1 Tax=Neisseria shayeganii 871 TaxID=1032488 RepID=G4CKY7_9NEIS|nr:hypothetical protein HMPREF9371_2278 [Neisseria shayeganii 871]
MLHRVINQVLKHFADGLFVAFFLGIIQIIDVLHQYFVLFVDVVETGIQIRGPINEWHVFAPAVVKKSFY